MLEIQNSYTRTNDVKDMDVEVKVYSHMLVNWHKTGVVSTQQNDKKEKSLEI